MLFNNSVYSSVYITSNLKEWMGMEHWHTDTDSVNPKYSKRNLSQWHFDHHKLKKKMAVQCRGNVRDIGHGPSTTKKVTFQLEQCRFTFWHIRIRISIWYKFVWKLFTFLRCSKQIFGNYLDKIGFLLHLHILVVPFQSPHILESQSIERIANC